MRQNAREQRDACAPPREIGALFVSHRARIYRWALAHALTHEQALDVTQETFARMLAARPLCAGEGAQIAWLKRTASNLAVDARRRSKPPRLVPAPMSRAEGSPMDDADREKLRRAIGDLTELQRLVLMEKAVEGLTFAEIAAQLGIAVPTVKTHYARALNTVRSAMGATMGGDP
jgi:RNA polymerase sigma-70 factor (ECF subfamily)